MYEGAMMPKTSDNKNQEFVLKNTIGSISYKSMRDDGVKVGIYN
jgi:hypothetical protein